MSDGGRSSELDDIAKRYLGTTGEDEDEEGWEMGREGQGESYNRGSSLVEERGGGGEGGGGDGGGVGGGEGGGGDGGG